MTKFWMVVMMAMGVVVAQENGKKDHNRGEHDALCDLLRVAVRKWEEKGSSLSDPLKTALGRTIFGDETEKDLERLRKGLPKVYGDVVTESDSRGLACGRPYIADSGAPLRWSGHSAPHGLVCLCTSGDGGWPLNESDIDKLCWKDKKTLRAVEGNKGWSEKKDKGEAQIKAAWGRVVIPCLKGDAGGDLREALETFLGKLKNKSVHDTPSRYQLGEGQPNEHDACTGTPPRGVCVSYFNNTATTKRMPWWVDLQQALEAEAAKKQKQLAEAARQQRQSRKPETHHTTALKLTTPTNKPTDEKNPEIISVPPERVMRNNGAHIIQPLWLLSAAFLL